MTHGSEWGRTPWRRGQSKDREKGFRSGLVPVGKQDSSVIGYLKSLSIRRAG